jgi:hypothetical protein
MKKLVPAFKLLLLVGVIGAIALATDVYAKKPGGGGCPRNIVCPDVWDPVICSDGRVYSNDCYAYRACATGCVPYGDGGPVPLLEAKKPGGGGGGCPRNINCPDLWDPVICNNGQVYSNGCYAYRDCATGCVPYGDDSMMSLEVKPGSGGCPRRINCLDVWDPVICSNGQVYSNDCYAYRACATGCVPYGDDTIITESEQCSQ